MDIIEQINDIFNHYSVSNNYCYSQLDYSQNFLVSEIVPSEYESFYQIFDERKSQLHETQYLLRQSSLSYQPDLPMVDHFIDFDMLHSENNIIQQEFITAMQIITDRFSSIAPAYQSYKETGKIYNF